MVGVFVLQAGGCGHHDEALLGKKKSASLRPRRTSAAFR